MPFDKPVRRIASVGTGVIGASWAAQYLARGFDVIATDPAPNAETNLRKYVDDAWESLKSIGLSPGARRDRLKFTTDMKQALSEADFVQENGPERPDFKIKLYAEMDAVTPPDSLIASSSSSSPIQMHDVSKVPARRAPEIGEHNDEVLKDLGFTAGEIDGLQASGAVPHVQQSSRSHHD